MEKKKKKKKNILNFEILGFLIINKRLKLKKKKKKKRGF